MIRTDFNQNWHVEDIQTAFSGFMNRGKELPPPKRVDLPHDAMIFTARDKDSPTGGAGGFFTPQDLTYTKRFFVPGADEGKAMFLEFEGVYMSATVFVNNEYAGRCAYAYGKRLIRIQDFIHYGGENVVTVNVLNTQQPNSRWYSGTGIFRNVKLLTGPALHVAPDGLRVTTLDVSGGVSALRVEADIINEAIGGKMAFLEVVLKDAAGAAVAEQRAKFTAASGERFTVEQHFYLQAAKLWSPEEPSLYTCEASIVLGDETVDSAAARFGIRRLTLDTLRGFAVNGKSYKLKGGCIHHDNGVLGAAAFEDAEARRVRLLKAAGYNAIRSAHNPASTALLDACDELGMLVMDEYSDVWAWAKSKHDYAGEMPQNWEADIESMVRRDYNHPSVVFYSVGNEVPEVGTRHTAAFARRMAAKIRSLDATRYITNAIQSLLGVMLYTPKPAQQAAPGGESSGEVNEMMSKQQNFHRALNESPMIDEMLEESCAQLDVVGYNYALSRYARDHARFPHHIFVGTETFPADLAVNWREVEKHPWVLGDFSWTAWDYLGEAGIGKVRYGEDDGASFFGAFPWIVAWCGDFDITGFRRPVSYWRETVWGGRGHTPYIAVQKPAHYGQQAHLGTWSWTDSVSSWTWSGFEGKGVVAEVYADADEVELFVNGASLGKKPVGDDFKDFYCKWDTVYTPGTIEAVAYVGGREAGRFALNTAGAPKLCLTAEKTALRAGSNDLCFVNIELRDANGNLNTADSREIALEVAGPASLQGSGSANPTLDENFFDAKHLTFFGRALAVVRAGEEKGAATLTVRAEGLKSAVLTIECK